MSERRFQVYETLFHHGPLTAGEIWNYYLKGSGAQLNSISPRTAELERRGVIRPVEERMCSVTGRTCIAWDVTDRLPQEPTNRKVSKNKIDELEERILRLERRLAAKNLSRSTEEEQLAFKV